jgi:hypothetical protein
MCAMSAKGNRTYLTGRSRSTATSLLAGLNVALLWAWKPGQGFHYLAPVRPLQRLMQVPKVRRSEEAPCPVRGQSAEWSGCGILGLT